MWKHVMSRPLILCLLTSLLPRGGLDAVAGQVNPGNLVVTTAGVPGIGPGQVVSINPTTGAQNLVSSGGYLVNPLGVAVAPNGNLFVADANGFGGSGRIEEIDPQTGAQILVSSGGLLVSPTNIQIAPNGDLIVVDFGPVGGTGNIIRVNAATGAQTLITTGGLLVNPFGLAISSGGHQLYVTDPDATPTAGAVFRIDAVTGAQTVVASGGLLVHPTGISILPNGNLAITDGGDLPFGGTQLPRTVEIDPLTGVQTLIARGFVNHQNAYDPATGQLFVTQPRAYGELGEVSSVNLATGGFTLVSSDGLLNTPEGITIFSVPEPSTVLLMTVGAVFLILVRWVPFRHRRVPAGAGC